MSDAMTLVLTYAVAMGCLIVGRYVGGLWWLFWWATGYVLCFAGGWLIADIYRSAAR